MSAVAPHADRLLPQYAGLRMAADEFLQISEDGFNYELIDGIVMMTPSPTPKHQAVLMEIAAQIALYLRNHPAGQVFPETDVPLGRGPTGGDLVYRPELVFLRSERLPEITDRITGAPDLVVEVVSRGSRRFDSETKKNDYERAGVLEYWLIDPERNEMIFFRLERGGFVEVAPQADGFASTAVPGFVLDLVRVRDAFEPW